jgi:nucleoid DNA-binding protein
VDINKHILNFLTENSSVAVPHLGRFNAVDKPAVVIGSVILPPVRSVTFDNADDVDDGLLTAFIAKAENCSVESVKDALEEFYTDITKKLIYKKPVILDGFGILSLDDDGEISFVPDTKLNIVKSDAFGLKEINLQPVSPPVVPVIPVIPEPVVVPPVFEIPEPIVTPPVVTPPVETPVFTPVIETPKPVVTETPVVQPETPTQPLETSSDSLFSGNINVRENTNRRRTEILPPVVQPRTQTKPQQRKPVPPQHKPKSQKTPSSGSGFPVWIIIIILVAGAGAGGYFLYPEYFDKYFGSEKTPPVAQAPIGEPDQTTSEDSTSIEKSLNNATEVQNALNPEPVSKPDNTVKADPKTAPQVEPKPEKVEPKPTPAPKTTVSKGNIGNGRYIVVAGSFSTVSRAQKYGNQIASTGETFEILNYGNGLVRVGVASFNDLASAKDKVARLQSNSYCDDAWVYSGGRP